MLAADLHDFVAHDITGIAVVAQSARIVGASGSGALIEQVEQAATRALRRLDRSIRLMRDDDGRPTPPYGLADVPDLVDTYPLPIDLTVAVADRDDISAAIQTTAYRVISEAITNVARHAGPTTPVRVAATRRDAQLDIIVANDLPASATPPHAPGSGTGLASLRADVEALDGTMRAGVEKGSWQVRVTLPID
jgi:signal transduction histidine kinase